MRQIAEWAVPTAEQFRNEILPFGQPAVLRDVARDWPLVIAGKQDQHKCMEMLAAHATDAAVEILRADPEEEGRFHYGRDGRSLNFVRGRASLPTFLAALREEEETARPYAMAVQGLLAERLIPGFATAHSIPMAPASVEPRLWIGNAAKVATHQDPVDNVAVVASGRRRFTLFPPSAEPNLYMGPTYPTPAGTAVSMVHVTAPDLERFPLFSSALDSAQEAELAAGDAIYIPRDWFHHVETLDRFNMLVNYWWGSSS
jgi:hypothetical protein